MVAEGAVDAVDAVDAVNAVDAVDVVAEGAVVDVVAEGVVDVVDVEAEGTNVVDVVDVVDVVAEGTDVDTETGVEFDVSGGTEFISCSTLTGVEVVDIKAGNGFVDEDELESIIATTILEVLSLKSRPCEDLPTRQGTSEVNVIVLP